MGKIDVDGITVVFGGLRTVGDEPVSNMDRILECGISRLCTIFGMGRFSNCIRLREPEYFVSMFSESAVAELSPGMTTEEIRQLVCFAESQDGDHVTVLDAANTSEFFCHSHGFDVRRYPASVREFFGLVDVYRHEEFQGLPHYFQSDASNSLGFAEHAPEVGQMTSQAILDYLSRSQMPESVFITEDAFIATLDSLGSLVVLQKLNRLNRPSMTTRTWWLTIISEEPEHLASAIKYAHNAMRLGFRR